MQGIKRQPAKQEFDDPFRTIFRMYARASQFKELLVLVAGKERRDVEFALAVETTVTRGDIAAQHAVGAEELRLVSPEGIARLHVEIEEVIAKLVETADIAPDQACTARRHGITFFEEDL